MARISRPSILLSLAAMALVSCAANKGIYLSYQNPELQTKPIDEVVGQGYRRPSVYSTLSSTDKTGIEASLSSVYSFGSRRRVIPSLGRSKLTVIPVDFASYPGQDLGEEAISDIKKAFDGDNHGNQYFSVKEYYDKASFHRFQLEPNIVSNWFRPSLTYEFLASLPNANRTKAALVDIYNEAIAWYNTSNPIEPLKNGDPVFFVYSAPYSGMDGGVSDRGNMMWAFVINDPAPIGWSSYHMLHPNGDNKVDAHTNIHEFGHMLGLVDYYDTDSSSDPSPCSPLGRMDMMDCSLGDHDAFSKLLLGWNKPYVVEGECEITIRQSTGNGDCILLTSDWNGTPFDEYLLLELYTPSYLNAFDAKAERGDGARLMGKPGIKITHVDARLGVYSDRSKAPVRYLSEGPLGSDSIDFYQNNNGRNSGSTVRPKRDGFLLRTLPVNAKEQVLPAYFIASDSDKDVTYEGGTLRYRDVLFQQGQGFGPSSYGFFRFNSKGALGYDFTIKELTSTYAKVSFAKKA